MFLQKLDRIMRRSYRRRKIRELFLEPNGVPLPIVWQIAREEEVEQITITEGKRYCSLVGRLSPKNGQVDISES